MENSLKFGLTAPDKSFSCSLPSLPAPSWLFQRRIVLASVFGFSFGFGLAFWLLRLGLASPRLLFFMAFYVHFGF